MSLRDTSARHATPALLISGRNPRILAEVAAVHAARGDSAAAEAVYQEVRGRAWKLATWAPLRADPEGLGILRSTGLLHP
jgi:hypothetical protein